MNLRNFLTLTVRAVDFNLVAKQPDLVAKLRELTIASYSGLNYELNRMLKDVEERSVNCKILLAYRFKELVGWALLSKEDSDFHFSHEIPHFRGTDGWMFQLFVNPKFRRQGIGSELFKLAEKLIGGDPICVSPWNDASSQFYDNFPNSNQRAL